MPTTKTHLNADEARLQAMQDERDGDALLAETEIRHALS